MIGYDLVYWHWRFFVHINGNSRRYLEKKDVLLYLPNLLVKLGFVGEALREACYWHFKFVAPSQKRSKVIAPQLQEAEAVLFKFVPLPNIIYPCFPSKLCK